MQQLKADDYQALIAHAVIETEDAYGPKVYRLANGNYLKLFRVKRMFSLAKFFPYALRFYDNSIKLSAKNIHTVSCVNTYTIPSIERTAVEYSPLEGDMLRSIEPSQFPLRDFASYFAELHNQGVYFRSCHLGNIIMQVDGQFGLIDIADLKVNAGSLSWRKRLRNFNHLKRYPEDVAKLELDKNAHFWSAYCAASRLDERELNLIKEQVLQPC